MGTNCQTQQWGISCQFWLNKQSLFNSKCILNKLANIYAWFRSLKQALHCMIICIKSKSRKIYITSTTYFQAFFQASMWMWIISSQILHTVHRLHKTTNFPPALFAVRTEYIGKLRLLKFFQVIKCVYESA